MLEILQQLCQNLYYIVFLYVTSIIPAFRKLLIPPGYGHFCSITDELKLGVKLLNVCMLQNTKGPVCNTGPTIGEFTARNSWLVQVITLLTEEHKLQSIQQPVSSRPSFAS